MSNFPKFTSNLARKFFSQEKKEHINAAIYRKKVSPKIKAILSELAENTEADRAMLFEYSNGSSNLVGLPFLYVTATIEVFKPLVTPVFQNYQKVNILVISDFIEHIDTHGYFYAKDIEDIKCQYPMIHAYMAPNNVKSALFYALYDDRNSIGLIALTTQKETFERHNVLPRAAEAAQQISSLLNYDKIKEELE